MDGPIMHMHTPCVRYMETHDEEQLDLIKDRLLLGISADIDDLDIGQSATSTAFFFICKKAAPTDCVAAQVLLIHH